jgi:P-aminobenzoate N-oxygenase AurF
VIRYVQVAPHRPVNTRPEEPSSHLDSEEAVCIAQAFAAPLQGAYVWDYRAADRVLQRLYSLGKSLSWDAQTTIHWDQPLMREGSPYLPSSLNPYAGWEPYEALTDADKLHFAWHQYAWMLSQFLHGEQGALLVAAQLVACAPTHDAKLFASSQTFDEARHVEAFARYLRERVRILYPINVRLKALLDQVMCDPRWDQKLIGMQMVIEALALAALPVQRQLVADPVLHELLDYVLRDEGRHVAFGVVYLEQLVGELSAEEREKRAMFAFKACRVMRDRIVPTDVFRHFGLDVAEGQRRYLDAGEMDRFRSLLFTRIMPNLNKIGLITERVAPLYAQLGLLELASLEHDGNIDWVALEGPARTSGAAARNP